MPSSIVETDLFLLFVRRFDAAGVPYMITGSVASMLYGEPRLTHDVDVVIEIANDAAVDRLCAAFPDDLFYCTPPEVVKVEVRRGQRGHFNIIHHLSGFKADVYLTGADPLHRWGMARRQSFSLGEHAVWVAPPEYVIVRKLEYFREGQSQKHIRDIRAMLETSGDRIDGPELAQKIEQLGLASEWALCRDG